jgi:hypothetical protein
MSRKNPLLYAVMARWSAVNLKTHLLGDRLLIYQFFQAFGSSQDRRSLAL